MDAKDVLGDGCEQMLAAANSKRHAELITRLKELVVGLEEGRFVASTPLDADAGGGNEISGEDGDGPELPATLTDDQVDEILVPLRLAMESKSPKVIRAALASLQRLVAHGLLSGDADLRVHGPRSIATALDAQMAVSPRMLGPHADRRVFPARWAGDASPRVLAASPSTSTRALATDSINRRVRSSLWPVASPRWEDRAEASKIFEKEPSDMTRERTHQRT